MSSCPIQTEYGHNQHRSFNNTPKIFTDGTSGKSWYLRCRWWITRHFSNSKLESEIESGIIIISLEWLTMVTRGQTFLMLLSDSEVTILVYI